MKDINELPLSSKINIILQLFNNIFDVEIKVHFYYKIKDNNYLRMLLVRGISIRMRVQQKHF